MTVADRRTALLKQLVSSARATVTYQVGLPLGATRLRRTALWLRRFEPIELPAVERYLDAVRGLPIGTERLHWQRSALREKDVELEAINREFRDPVFETCYDIIARYSDAGLDEPVG